MVVSDRRSRRACGVLARSCGVGCAVRAAVVHDGGRHWVWFLWFGANEASRCFASTAAELGGGQGPRVQRSPVTSEGDAPG